MDAGRQPHRGNGAQRPPKLCYSSDIFEQEAEALPFGLRGVDHPNQLRT